MTWAGIQGWLPEPMVVHDPWSRWAATAAACVLIAVVHRIELVRLRGALDSAHTDPRHRVPGAHQQADDAVGARRGPAPRVCRRMKKGPRCRGPALEA
jgi:hypothetical protein